MRFFSILAACTVAAFPVFAQADYSTGFETVEGYTVGNLNGQNDWVTNGTGANFVKVSTANPSSGSQHVRITDNTGVSSGTVSLAFSPDTALLPTDATLTTIDIAISALGGADNDIVIQSPTQGFITAEVNFSYLGDIKVVDNTGSGPALVDTTANWTPGPYFKLGIAVDPTADSIKYYINNSLIYTGVAGVFAGTFPEEVLMVNDNWQNPGETADFDNLSVSVVPEPAFAGLAVAGASLILRRRRV